MSEPVIPLTAHLQQESAHVAQQADTVLKVVAQLTDSLYRIDEFEDYEDGDVPKSPVPAMDGGVKSSMETTLMKACDRLDSILDNPKNWSPHGSCTLVKEFRKTQASTRTTQLFQQRALRAQESSVAEQQKPHRVFEAVLARGVGEWTATYSGENFDLVGRGRSPASALADYDRAFFAELTQEQVDAESKILPE